MAKLYYKHTDAMQKTYTENLGHITYTIAQLQDTTTGAAHDCNDLARALNSLSTDTYSSNYATDEVDIDSILAGE